MLTDEQIELCIQDWSCTGWGDRLGEVVRISRAIESAAIDAFLARTGKYLTNDASREAAIADATAPLLECIEDLERQLEEAKKDAGNGIEVRLDSSGQLDEVVGHGHFHLEQMSASHWWMCIDGGNGRSMMVNLHSRGKIRANYDKDVFPDDAAIAQEQK